jgi:phage tail sheath protein FI
VAKTIANKVNTLIEKPHKYIIKNVAINETGISIKGRNAIDQSLKNKKIIISTRITEINKVSATSTTNVANCQSLKNTVGNNNYAFIDSGYKLQYDRYNDVTRWIPLNGDIAGLAARTDLTNDPWWSFAGLNRGQIKNVIKLAFNPSQTDRDIIYPKGINPVVTFQGEGTILFGDRTAQTKPSAFDRINVRRLFIVLEKAISIAAKYQLFEFNDSFTRAMFVSMVEPFLRDVQARRGITDFKVICDETNNTPAVIDSNRFVADLYVKPNRVASFIQLNFTAVRSGVSFEEIAVINQVG